MGVKIGGKEGGLPDDVAASLDPVVEDCDPVNQYAHSGPRSEQSAVRGERTGEASVGNEVGETHCD